MHHPGFDRCQDMKHTPGARLFPVRPVVPITCVRYVDELNVLVSAQGSWVTIWDRNSDREVTSFSAWTLARSVLGIDYLAVPKFSRTIFLIIWGASGLGLIRAAVVNLDSFLGAEAAPRSPLNLSPICAALSPLAAIHDWVWHALIIPDEYQSQATRPESIRCFVVTAHTAIYVVRFELSTLNPDVDPPRSAQVISIKPPTPTLASCANFSLTPRNAAVGCGEATSACACRSSLVKTSPGSQAAVYVYLGVGYWDGRLKVDLLSIGNNGEGRVEKSAQFAANEAHFGCVTDLELVDFPNGQTLLFSCGDDRRVVPWRLLLPGDCHCGLVPSCDQPIAQLVPAGDFGDFFAHGSRVWRIVADSGEVAFAGPGSGPSGMGPDFDGAHLVSVGQDAVVNLWHIEIQSTKSGANFRAIGKVGLKLADSREAHKGSNIWALDLARGADKALRVVTGGADGGLIEHKFIDSKSSSTIVAVPNENFLSPDHQSRNEFPRSYVFLGMGRPFFASKVPAALLVASNAAQVFVLEKSREIKPAWVISQNLGNFPFLRGRSLVSTCVVQEKSIGALVGRGTQVLFIITVNVTGEPVSPKIRLVNLPLVIKEPCFWALSAGWDGRLSSYFAGLLRCSSSGKVFMVAYQLIQEDNSFNVKVRACYQLDFSDGIRIEAGQNLPTSLAVCNFWRSSCDRQSHSEDGSHPTAGWLVGTRSGHIFGFRAALEGLVMEELRVKALTVARVHCPEAVTCIQVVESTGAQPLVLSTGRDGHLCASEISSVPPDLVRVHSLLMPFGQFLEGVASIVTGPLESRSDSTGSKSITKVVVYGFHKAYFILFDVITETRLAVIESGGVHRAWAFDPGFISTRLRGDGELFSPKRLCSPEQTPMWRFAWTRAGTLMVAEEDVSAAQNTTTGLSRVWQMGTHGREIKASSVVAVSDRGIDHFLMATGAEDTEVRVWRLPVIDAWEAARGLLVGLQAPDRAAALGWSSVVLRGHTAGISKLVWAAGGKTLFSAGGFGEVFVWSIRSILRGGLTVGAQLISTWPNRDKDRVTTMDVVDIERGVHLAAIALSDSFIHIIKYREDWPSPQTGRSVAGDREAIQGKSERKPVWETKARFWSWGAVITQCIIRIFKGPSKISLPSRSSQSAELLSPPSGLPESASAAPLLPVSRLPASSLQASRSPASPLSGSPTSTSLLQASPRPATEIAPSPKPPSALQVSSSHESNVTKSKSSLSPPLPPSPSSSSTCEPELYLLTLAGSDGHLGFVWVPEQASQPAITLVRVHQNNIGAMVQLSIQSRGRAQSQDQCCERERLVTLTTGDDNAMAVTVTQFSDRSSPNGLTGPPSSVTVVVPEGHPAAINGAALLEGFETCNGSQDEISSIATCAHGHKPLFFIAVTAGLDQIVRTWSVHICAPCLSHEMVRAEDIAIRPIDRIDTAVADVSGLVVLPNPQAGKAEAKAVDASASNQIIRLVVVIGVGLDFLHIDARTGTIMRRPSL